VRVIELASVVMGPLAGQILGDLGADVIKVETAGSAILAHSAAPTRLSRSATDRCGYIDRNWQDFFTILGHPEHATDPRFATRAARDEHSEELYRLIEELTRAFTSAHLQRACAEHDVAAAPEQSLSEVVDSGYARDAGLFEVAQHPTEGAYRLIGYPVRYSQTPPTVRRHCPHLGEHTAEILAEIGLPTGQSDDPIVSNCDVSNEGL
jgi:crotonobetainyl-CoA:carnitine CoA-transferase CaiB-like acyl-CoA transferase